MELEVYNGEVVNPAEFKERCQLEKLARIDKDRLTYPKVQRKLARGFVRTMTHAGCTDKVKRVACNLFRRMS